MWSKLKEKKKMGYIDQSGVLVSDILLMNDTTQRKKNRNVTKRPYRYRNFPVQRDGQPVGH